MWALIVTTRVGYVWLVYTSESENNTERARHFFEDVYDKWTKENLIGENYNNYHILTTRVIELDRFYYPFNMNLEDLEKYEALMEGQLM